MNYTYVVLSFDDKNEIVACYEGFTSETRAITWAMKNINTDETFKVMISQKPNYNGINTDATVYESISL